MRIRAYLKAKVGPACYQQGVTNDVASDCVYQSDKVCIIAVIVTVPPLTYPLYHRCNIYFVSGFVVSIYSEFLLTVQFFVSTVKPFE